MKRRTLQNPIKTPLLWSGLVLIILLAACGSRPAVANDGPETGTGENAALAGQARPESLGSDNHPPGADLPPGPRLLIQTPDNSIQYFSLDGSNAVLVAAAPATLLPAGFGDSPMADGPMVYLRQWSGGLYVLDTPAARLIPLEFIPTPAPTLAVRPLTEGTYLDDSPISLAWGGFFAAHTASARVYLSAPDGSHQTQVLQESFSASEAWAQLVPWRWRQDGQLYYTRDPVDGRGGFATFVGAANLWRFDPASGASQELFTTGGALCLDGISPDDLLLAHHCDVGQVTLLDLETGATTAVSLPDGTASDAQVGSVRFSPDGARIAFAVMSGGFDRVDETQGVAAVSDGLAGPSTVVATSELGAWFSVAAWLPGEWLVLQSHQAGPNGWPAVWAVHADGSGLVRLADGTFLAKFDG